MKIRATALTAVLTCLLLATAGCQSTQRANAELCTDCGEVKGAAMCCAPGQVTCAGCQLSKGSPGCCSIEKGSTEPVYCCGKCGNIKGTEACCQPGTTKCDSCGLDKGSPGCCKLDAE